MLRSLMFIQFTLYGLKARNIIPNNAYTYSRQVTRAKSKSGAVVKHQKVFVVLKTTSNAKPLF